MTRERVGVRYSVRPMRDGRPAGDEDTTITDLELTRLVKSTPVTASGAVQYSKAQESATWTHTIPVREVQTLTAELIDWLAYFALGRPD